MGLSEIWTLVAGVASALVLLGGAASVVIKTVKMAKAPNETQNKRIKQVEDDVKAVNADIAKIMQFLNSDYQRLEKLEASTRITMRAQLALLSHGLDGNNVHQMEEAKKEIENYLINR